MRSWLWGGPHDDLHAGVGGVVLSRALLAIHVADGVGVLLGELVVLHQAGEAVLPEHQGVLHLHALHHHANTYTPHNIVYNITKQIIIGDISSSRVMKIACN
jgi:hypothetical protein